MKKIAFVAVLIAVIVFGIVAYSFAAPLTQTDSVTVNASVKSLLTITVAPADKILNWLLVDPGSSQSQTIHVTIDSNRSGILSAGWNASPAAYGLTSTTNVTSQNFGKAAGQPFTDLITFAPTYTSPVDTLGNFILIYTATQS